jgi:hypothetical protein
MTSTTAEAAPPQVAALVAGAGEVLIGLADYANLNPAPLVVWLMHMMSPTARVTCQCAHGTPLAVVAALLEQHCEVVEGQVAASIEVYLDRKAGYQLPGWRPISDAHGRACRLVWQQSAAYTRVTGTVVALYPPAISGGSRHLFRLAENPKLWLAFVADQAAPQVGQAVRCLVRHDFSAGNDVPLLDCVALL